MKSKLRPVRKSAEVETDTPSSAVFTISDTQMDRDGDRVNVHGLHFDNWKAAGAPVMFSHGEHPVPIGSCINPETGELEVWTEGDKLKARVHFDMADPEAKYLAGKVARGFLRSASIAFVPINHEKHAYGPGHDFIEADLTELSLTPIPSNPRAVADAPKSLRKCFGRYCKDRTQADIESGRTHTTDDRTEHQEMEEPLREEINERYEHKSRRCKCNACRTTRKCPCSAKCMCKAMEADGGSEEETGEANLVGRGEIPDDLVKSFVGYAGMRGFDLTDAQARKALRKSTHDSPSLMNTAPQYASPVLNDNLREYTSPDLQRSKSPSVVLRALIRHKHSAREHVANCFDHLKEVDPESLIDGQYRAMLDHAQREREEIHKLLSLLDEHEKGLEGDTKDTEQFLSDQFEHPELFDDDTEDLLGRYRGGRGGHDDLDEEGKAMGQYHPNDSRKLRVQEPNRKPEARRNR